MPSPHPHTSPPPHYPPMPAFPGRPPLSPHFAVRPGESGLNHRSIGETHSSPYNHFPQKGNDSMSIPHHLQQHPQQYTSEVMDTKPMFPSNRGMEGSPYGSHRFLPDHHLSSYSPYSSHHPFSHPGNYGPPPGSFPTLPPSLTSSTLPSPLPPSSFGNSSFPQNSMPSSLPQTTVPSSVGGSGNSGNFPSGPQNSPPLEAFVQLLLAMNSDDQLKVCQKSY